MGKTEIEKAFEKVNLALAKARPFYYFFLKNFTVKESKEEVNEGGGSAAVNDKNELILYQSFARMDIKRQCATIAHELCHILYQHIKRAKEYAKTRGITMDKGFITMANIAGDTVINYIINRDFGVNFPTFDELWKKFDPNIDYSKESIETLLDKLPRKGKGKGGDGREGEEGGEGRGEMNKETASDMDPNANGEKTIQEGRIGKNASEKEIKEKAIEAHISAKVAGTGKSEIQRAIEEMLNPKINWRQAVKQAIVYGIMKLKVQTWTKPNRKLGDLYAGAKQICKPDIYCFIDTSGSIGDEELKQFIAELKGMIKEVNKIEVIWWNDGVVGKDVIKSRSDIIKLKPPGWGGTCFLPVIREYKKELKKPWNISVVLTDCYWYDKEECEKELRKLRCHKILVSSTKEVIEGFDKVFHIR